MNVPYPSEIRIVPRRRRPWRVWLFIAVSAAFVITALAWPHRAHPQPAGQKPAAAVTSRQAVHARPAKAGITVTVGRVTYACTPLKPKR